MSRVPEGWRRVSLHQIAHIQTGLAKGGKNINDPVKLPYLRVANVQDGYLDLEEIKEIEVDRSKIERYLLQDQDILLTEGGDFDKLGRGTIWQNQIVPCLHQNHVFAVRLNQDVIMPYFFAQQAASPYGKQYFLSIAKRTTNLASINKGQLSEFPVLLPPLAEQRKIAQILSTWDEAIALVEALIAALTERKKGLMQRLLTGEVRFPGFEDEWEEVRLGEIFSERKEKDFDHLPLGAITREGGIVWRDELDRRDTSSEDKSNYLRICPGDIGYNTMRMWQGVSGVSDIEAIVSPAYTICIPSDIVDVQFMGYLFKLPETIHTFWRYSQGLVKDTLALKFKNFSEIKREIPPTLVEQKRIAEILLDLDSNIQLFSNYAEQLRAEKKGLMQRLLTGEVRVQVGG